MLLLDQFIGAERPVSEGEGARCAVRFAFALA